MPPRPTDRRQARHGVAARVGLAALGLVGGLLLAELLARWLAPQATTRVSAVYRPSEAPGVGYTMKPSLDTFALGADLRTNALGFRGPDWNPRKRPGSVRVALIGDSHAFGFGVPYDRSVGEVLARRLRAALGRPVEVLNFAVSGHNARQQLAVLRELALDFAPDVVVLMPCNNDDEPALFAAASGYLVAQPGADLTLAWLRQVAARSALVWVIRDAGSRLTARAAAELSPPPSAPAAPPLPARAPEVPAALDTAVGAPLREMIRSSRAAGARVVLASFAGPLEWRLLFQQTAHEARIPLVEVLEMFPEARDWDELIARFGLGWDPHLGPEAHRRWGYAIADVVAAHLQSSPAGVPR